MGAAPYFTQLRHPTPITLLELQKLTSPEFPDARRAPLDYKAGGLLKRPPGKCGDHSTLERAARS